MSRQKKTNASGGREVCDSPNPTAAGGVPPAAMFEPGDNVRVELESGSVFTSKVISHHGNVVELTDKLYPSVSLNTAKVTKVETIDKVDGTDGIGTSGDGGTPASAEGSGESETPRPPEAPAPVAAATATCCSDVAASSTATRRSTLKTSTKPESTAIALHFPAFAANLDAAERYLELHVPDGEDAQAAYIRQQVRGERACGLRAAICTAIVRMTRFPQKCQYKAFCEWMASAAGVKERVAITYQNAGALILSPAFADLTSEQKQRVLGCTYVKLEIIASAGLERLAVIAADPAIEDLNVEDLRAWVKEKQLTDKERKLLNDARETKAKAEQYRKTPAGRVGLAVTEITKLEGLIDQEAVADPLAALRAGFVLHQAALNRIEVKGDMPLLELAKIQQSLEQELVFVKELIGKA